MKTESMALAPGGYASITAHIEKLEGWANKGILSPESALHCCRLVRNELYKLQQTVRSVRAVLPETAEGSETTF